MKSNNDDDSIKVCIRMRPLLKPYEDEEAWTINEQTNTISSLQGQRMETSFSAFAPNNLNLNDTFFMQRSRDTRRKYHDTNTQYSFQFDHFAGMEMKTQQIYNEVGKSITASVLDGYNGTIFMYGQTTSGKTYTMLGTPDSPGILPCAVRDVFLEINKRKDMLFKVWVSYIEIYNEVINDLLVPGVTNLKISEDPKFGVVVNGAKQQQVWSFDQAIILMNYGEESRVYKETNVHEHSSRSHTLFRVFIESQSNSLDTENIVHRYSCLNLVDLAGSERLTDYEGKAETMGETGYINKSLFVLANVINKLAEGKKQHIPYRDSKLTRILSQALGGNSLAAIICTISPANINFYQTLSTLRFATRAKTVKNTPEVNELTYGLEIKEQSVLQEKINKLQDELMSTREENYRIANSKLEIQISLENANEKIIQLEKENALLRKKYEQLANERVGSDEKPRSNMGTPSASSGDFGDKFNSLLQSYNEEKTRRQKLESKLKEQGDEGQDLNPREIVFMENLLWNINSIFVDNETKRQVNENSLQNWFNYTENLAAQYKIEVINLQNKFRDSLRELVQEFVPESLDEIYNYLTTMNSRSNPASYEEARKLEMIIPKILNKKVFDSVTFNPGKILGASDLSFALKAQAVKEEYDRAVKRINTIYDDTRNALEEYSRTKVSAMKMKEPQGKGSKASNFQETNIVNITNDHQEKLTILRKLYEDELKSLESRYLEATSTTNSFDSGRFPNPLSILKKTDFVIDRERESQSSDQSKKDTKSKSSNVSNLSGEKSPKADLKVDDGTAGYLSLWGSGKDGRLGNGSEKSERVPKKIDYTKFRQVSCGFHHNAAIELNGKLYTWGKGTSGQLGTGSLENEYFPIYVAIPGNSIVYQVACGWQHTMALTQDGQVYSWGKGSDGQLGHDNESDYSEPMRIRFFEKVPVRKIAAGHSHSAGISTKGELYMWGCNLDHRLLIPSQENQYSPSLTELSALKTREPIEVVDVALGVGHSAAITKSGSLYTGGVGTDGQLGTFIDEDTENSVIITRKGNQGMINQDESQDQNSSNFDMYEKYCFLHQVKTFGSHNKALKVACGDNYTLVLSDKNFYSFGKSSHFRLGHPNLSGQNIFQPRVVEGLRDQKVVQFSAGCRHAACVTQKGEVFGWGFNFYDQLGLGESDRDVEKPTKLTKLSGKNVKAISCGYFHSCAITE